MSKKKIEQIKIEKSFYGPPPFLEIIVGKRSGKLKPLMEKILQRNNGMISPINKGKRNCNCNNVYFGTYQNQETLEVPGRKKRVGIDRCIIKEIIGLWAKGITTIESCCGHNIINGYNIPFFPSKCITIPISTNTDIKEDRKMGIHSTGLYYLDVERKSVLLLDNNPLFHASLAEKITGMQEKKIKQISEKKEFQSHVVLIRDEMYFDRTGVFLIALKSNSKRARKFQIGCANMMVDMLFSFDGLLLDEETLDPISKRVKELCTVE